MSRPVKLSEAEIQAKLEKLPGWSLREGKLHRQFQFGSFVEAFGWMSSVALVAESMGTTPNGAMSTTACGWISPPTMPGALRNWTSPWRNA
jgi:pterin-4a-carbinolamine dehydratase